MESAQNQFALCSSTTPNQPSIRMRAVLMIFNADPTLMESVTPFIQIHTDTIFWDKIFALKFNKNHKTAAQWAYSIWSNEVATNGQPFAGALALPSYFKVAVLEALCLRWGLRG